MKRSTGKISGTQTVYSGPKKLEFKIIPVPADVRSLCSVRRWGMRTILTPLAELIKQVKTGDGAVISKQQFTELFGDPTAQKGRLSYLKTALRENGIDTPQIIFKGEEVYIFSFNQ